MSFSNNDCQDSAQNVADVLQNIEHIGLTWPSVALTDDDSWCLRNSIMESLTSMLVHLQTDIDDGASDGGVDETECGSSHEVLSEDNSEIESFDDDHVGFFFAFISDNVVVDFIQRRNSRTKTNV
jgi:hypothetical protein